MLIKQDNGLIMLSGKDTWAWRDLLNHLGATWSKTNGSWIFENPKNDKDVINYVYNFLRLNDVTVQLGEGVEAGCCRVLNEGGLQNLKQQLKNKGFFGGKDIQKGIVSGQNVAEAKKEIPQQKETVAVPVMFYNFNEPFKKQLLSQFNAQDAKELGWDKNPVFILLKQERRR